jgi:hypothetical protein
MNEQLRMAGEDWFYGFRVLRSSKHALFNSNIIRNITLGYGKEGTGVELENAKGLSPAPLCFQDITHKKAKKNSNLPSIYF